MSKTPTVFEEDRSNVLALPGFVLVVCLLPLGSDLFRGLPTQTAALVGDLVFAAGAVASLIWFVRWRSISPATLTIEQHRIAKTMRGGSETQTIVRRPDSQLRTEIASNGSASVTSFSWYVLFDVAAKKPRLKVDAFGVERVKKACVNHGWAFAEEKKQG